MDSSNTDSSPEQLFASLDVEFEPLESDQRAPLSPGARVLQSGSPVESPRNDAAIPTVVDGVLQLGSQTLQTGHIEFNPSIDTEPDEQLKSVKGFADQNVPENIRSANFHVLLEEKTNHFSLKNTNLESDSKEPESLPSTAEPIEPSPSSPRETYEPLEQKMDQPEPTPGEEKSTPNIPPEPQKSKKPQNVPRSFDASQFSSFFLEFTSFCKGISVQTRFHVISLFLTKILPIEGSFWVDRGIIWADLSQNR